MKDFFYNLKSLLLAPVKNESQATNVIFILCLISIISFSIFIYRYFSQVHNKLDSSIEDNVSTNLEIMKNEQSDYIQQLFNNL